jgi:DNA adenine methylase
VTLSNLRKAPFPWFGGKTHAAPYVWQALGDPAHFVDPFMGSLANLLLRPHVANRTYYSETVNDLDGLLVNAWRGIQLSPDATADAASWPVSEADLHARHLGILKWKADRQLEHLMGDPAFHDPTIAGWWIWGQSCWIGSGWCSGSGAWIADERGWLVRRANAEGIHRKRPSLELRGVLTDRIPGIESDDIHPMTMPEIRRWFRWLSARLRHVRILNGDWARAVTGGASKTLSVRMGDGVCGVFLDPPYGGDADRTSDLYSVDSLSVAVDVREWCAEHGSDPKYRIVLAGFDGEHESLASKGWRPVHWFTKGFLRGGMGNTSADGTHQQSREVLWMSPQCLTRGPLEPPPPKRDPKLAVATRFSLGSTPTIDEGE